MVEGYCSVCQKMVVGKREDFNIILGIILLCFCCIGFIVYLILYFTRPEDRCPYCKSIIRPPISVQQGAPPTQIQYQPQGSPIPIQTQQEVISKQNFCSNCGSKLELAVRYCPKCGYEVR
jgi:ribosomal protein S27AE